MGHIWDDVFDDGDREIYAAAGYGLPGGAGSRPALLVIDVTYDFVGDRREPILEMLRKWPSGCGEAGWEAVEHIGVLLEECRDANVPVFYTRAMDEQTDVTRGAWGYKTRYDPERPGVERRAGNRIHDAVAPQPGEIVLSKTKPSAFFGTPLASYLNYLRVDTVIVTGCTTSGCVRATVLDAFSMNYHVLVAEEGVFDRGELSHKVNLFDMNAKYADVVKVKEVVGYLEGLKRPT